MMKRSMQETRFSESCRRVKGSMRGLRKQLRSFACQRLLLSSMRRDPHVTGEEAQRLRRVRENSRIQVVTRTLVRPGPKGAGRTFLLSVESSELRIESYSVVKDGIFKYICVSRYNNFQLSTFSFQLMIEKNQKEN